MTSAFVRPEATATITVPEPVVAVPGYDVTEYTWGFESYSATQHPAQQVYSFGFETYQGTDYPAQTVYAQDFEDGTTGGWVASVGKLTNSGSVGSKYLWLTATFPDTATSARASQTFATVVGRSYTLTVSARYLSTTDAFFEVLGTQVPITSNTFTTYTHTFTATTTATVVTLAGNTYWDGFTLTRDTYTEVTNTGLDGWTGGVNVGNVKRTGNRSIQATSITRTFTGLTVGRSYTLRGYYLDQTIWAQASNTFTATATSMTRTLTGVGSPSHWDDITLTRNAWTEVHNSGLDGWSNGTVSSVKKRSGNYSLYASSPARAFTGLVVGHDYTLKAWVSSGDSWMPFALRFTAVATSMARTLTALGNQYWDDVELVHHVPPVMTNTPVLPISQGKVRLDENYSPYVTANFQVPLTSLELLEQIDPRNPQRVTVTTTEGVSGVTRTYDLGLRSRSVDHKAGTIDIELASDEILLHDRKHVATTADSTARQYETSLRAICNWALGKVGATLAPGTADADMTAAWDATNLQTNPTAGASLDGWINSQGTTARLATGTFPPNTGIASAVRCTMNAGATYGPYFNGGDDGNVSGGSLNVSIREKNLYRVTAWVRTSTSKSIRLSLQQRNSANALAGTNLQGPAFTTTANTWHRLTYVFQAYPGALRVGVYAYLASGTYAAGQTVDITGVTITEGTLDPTTYFDGGTTVRPDLYAYKWNGTPHLSTSERVAHVVRRPELFDWTPGQSLFDFLQPLINTAGLRLFCDENRVWRLVDPAEYEVPGYVVAQTGHNAIEGTDEITRNDDTWADAVVVKYTWTGPDGDTQSQYDVAGDPDGKTITRELEREYPGPGAAASILASYQGRGRTQSVTVVGQYAATPGMDVTVNLPGTLTQTGKVRAVELDLGSGINRIETRGLTDALPGSWVLWNPNQTWSQVNPTLLWKDA